MPGYTHLQRAQRVTVGHHLLAWFEMLERDRARFAFAAEQARPSPLGSGALAGVSWLRMPEFPRTGNHAWQAFVATVNPEKAPRPRNEIMNALQNTAASTILSQNFFATTFNQPATWIEPRRMDFDVRIVF